MRRPCFKTAGHSAEGCPPHKWERVHGSGGSRLQCTKCGMWEGAAEDENPYYFEPLDNGEASMLESRSRLYILSLLYGSKNVAKGVNDEISRAVRDADTEEQGGVRGLERVEIKGLEGSCVEDGLTLYASTPQEIWFLWR